MSSVRARARAAGAGGAQLRAVAARGPRLAGGARRAALATPRAGRRGGGGGRGRGTGAALRLQVAAAHRARQRRRAHARPGPARARPAQRGRRQRQPPLPRLTFLTAPVCSTLLYLLVFIVETIFAICIFSKHFPLGFKNASVPS